MTDRRARAAAWGAALALALSACAAAGDGGDRGAAPDPDDAAPTTTDDAHHDHDGDTHDHPGRDDQETDGEHAGTASAAEERTTTTERTLATLRDLDPARLAAAHDHGNDEHDGHEGHDAAASAAHPNGIDPERIVIPTIGVDADVIDLGLQPDGTMEVPTDFAQTGWFDRGPRPGRVGPAVIAGHVDDRSGPAVFHRLVELTPGDLIEVHGEDGELVTFVVRETERHAKDAFPTEKVYSGTPGPELRLITCGGEFDQDARSYRDNVIVYAERVDR